MGRDLTSFSDDDTWNRRRRHRRWMALMLTLVAILLLGLFMTCTSADHRHSGTTRLRQQLCSLQPAFASHFSSQSGVNSSSSSCIPLLYQVFRSGVRSSYEKIDPAVRWQKPLVDMGTPHLGYLKARNLR